MSRLAIVGIGLLLPAWGAIAGVPAPPRPGPMPASWLGWANDAFGGEVGNNPDDFRTNAFDLGVTIGQHWILAADLSFLTDKAKDPYETGSRSDELTLSLGRILSRQEDASVQFTAIAGVGLRYARDFGGADLQNEWHELIDFVPIEAEYDHQTQAGIAWASGQYLWLSDTRAPFGDCVFCDGSRIGLALDLAALGSTKGELQAEVGLSFVWAGHDSVIWTGLRQDLRGTDTMTRTASVVADEEQGTWYHYGLSAGAWTFVGGINIDNGYSFGRLGWMFDRVPVHNRLGRDELHTELGLTLNSYGLNGQIRWQPRWLRDFVPLGDHAKLLIDYRFGRIPGANFRDLSARYQQGLLGIDVSALAPRDGFQVNPFLYGAFGWRFEDIHHDGPDPELPSANDNGPAIQGGAGLRVTWGDGPHRGRGIQYGVSTSYDVWTVFDRRELQGIDPDDSDYELLQSNHTVALRLAITVGW